MAPCHAAGRADLLFRHLSVCPAWFHAPFHVRFVFFLSFLAADRFLLIATEVLGDENGTGRHGAVLRGCSRVPAAPWHAAEKADAIPILAFSLIVRLFFDNICENIRQKGAGQT